MSFINVLYIKDIHNAILYASMNKKYFTEHRESSSHVPDHPKKGCG